MIPILIMIWILILKLLPHCRNNWDEHSSESFFLSMDKLQQSERKPQKA